MSTQANASKANMSKRATINEPVQQKRRKTEEKSKFPQGDVLVTIMSFLKVVEKAFLKTVSKEFDEACKCSDSCVGVLNLKYTPASKLAKILASMPDRTFVKKLDLSQSNFAEDDFLTLEKFGGKFTNLQQLNLSAINIKDHTLACLSWMPLKSLDLSCCKMITNVGLTHLSGMRHLTELHLERCPQITNAGLQHLSAMPLEILSLPFEITDDDIQHLPRTLKSITPIGGDITDAGLSQLSHLQLTSLVLEDCANITNEGMKYLSYMPLQTLNLSYSNITDSGLACLARLRLTSLNLAWCAQITDNGIEYLSDMPLQHLVLRGCNMLTDMSMLMIRVMQLISLDLSGCKRITQDTLRECIPGMRLRILRVGGISFGTFYATRQFTSLVAPAYVDFDSSAPDYSDTDELATDDESEVDM